MMSAVYAANLARSSLTKGIAGRGAAMPAAETTAETSFATTAIARAISRTRVPSAPRTSSSDNNESNGTNSRTSSKADGVNEASSVAVKRYASRQATEGRWCSYHNTTNHSDTDCRAIKKRKRQRPRSRRSTRPHEGNLQRVRHPRLKEGFRASIHILFRD